MTLIDNVVDSIEAPSTTGHAVPNAILHATAIVAYQFGNSWPTLGPYSRARPDLAAKGWIISTTLTSNGPSRMYDIEAGGGHIANIGAFMRQADTRWGKPILYTFASAVHDMIQAAANQGYGRSDYYVYSAHPDSNHGKHICSPNVCGYPIADACQYTFQTPQNCDTGLFESYVLPGAKPVPPPVPPIPPLPEGIDPMSVSITTQQDGNLILAAQAEAKPGEMGEVIVLWTTQPVGSPDSGPVWHGEAGKTTHKWVSLGTPGK